MLIRQPSDIRSSEITSKRVYLNRREFVALGGLGLAGAISPAYAEQLAFTKGSAPPNETLTSFEDVTSYNNFYEFGVDKGDPAANAHTLTTRPWRVKIDGLVARP